MSIHHHPSDESLLALAAGRLRAGPALVLATHQDGCAVCRQRMAGLNALAGVLLAQSEPVAMSAGAFDRLMARIDRDAGRTADATPSLAAADKTSRSTENTALSVKSAQLGFKLPSSLADCEIGRWRRLGPGVHWSKLRLADDPTTRLMLLKIAAGSRLPVHHHHGIEFTQVLSGAYHDGRARFAAGDFDEADEEVEHQPVVDDDAECICLAAVDGKMVFHSRLARGLGWLVGM